MNAAVSRNANVGSFGPAAVASVTATVAKSTSWFSGYMSIAVAVLLLVVLFAVYYQTVGYYLQMGWEALGWSRAHNETVKIEVPGGGPSAVLTPASANSSDQGSSISKTLGGPLKRLEADVESALTGGTRKEVFNISRNVYTFGDAEPLCRAFGAELATYDQVKEAYQAGADWCNYGWIKGQLAVYPTQKSTYEKLQHGPEEERMSCGLPGVNGGYFPNADQRFGVNCYGVRPAESALDERIQREERSATAYDREVNRFKAERDSIGVNPWNSHQWSAS